MAQKNYSKNRIYLNNEQKAFIANTLETNSNAVLYQAYDFDEKKKAYSMMDHSAAFGDVAHLLLHGITFGGIVHQIGRAARWSDVAARAYNNGVERGLRAYMWNPQKRGLFGTNGAEQVVVIGHKFMSLYQEGEMQRKEIPFSNVVRVEYIAGCGLKVTMRLDNGRQFYVVINNVFDKMEELMQTVVLYTARANA